MPQREFEITIAPDGNVELHIKGYKGKSCLEAMKMFAAISSPIAGTVQEISAKVGESVESKDLLMKLIK